jgi:hypothetical protein
VPAAHEEGARLIVTDIRYPAIGRVVREFGAKAVEPDEILSMPATFTLLRPGRRDKRRDFAASPLPDNRR